MKKNFKNVEEMSAFVVHGINTPLTYLKGNLELIECSINSLEEGKCKKDLVCSREKMQQAILKIEEIINIVHTHNL